jgi:hypothetical protein
VSVAHVVQVPSAQVPREWFPVVVGEAVSSTTPPQSQGPVSRRVKNLFGRLSLNMSSSGSSGSRPLNNRSSSGSRPLNKSSSGERRWQIKWWLRRNQEAVAIVCFLDMVGVMVGVGFIVKQLLTSESLSTEENTVRNKY